MTISGELKEKGEIATLNVKSSNYTRVATSIGGKVLVKTDRRTELSAKAFIGFLPVGAEAQYDISFAAEPSDYMKIEKAKSASVFAGGGAGLSYQLSNSVNVGVSLSGNVGLDTYETSMAVGVGMTIKIGALSPVQTRRPAATQARLPAAVDRPIATQAAQGTTTTRRVQATGTRVVQVDQPIVTRPRGRTYMATFAINSNSLSIGALANIRRASQSVMGKQYAMIRVMSFAPESDDGEGNRALALQRAQAVVTELIRDGIDRNRISIEVAGINSSQLFPNTPEGIASSQRVAIMIIE
jgi:outer membrane protein OmpA-like peptidoglycan-associated protein